MTSNLNLDNKSRLLACPFADRCVLPKNAAICTDGFKECPEYNRWVEKIKG